MLTLVRTSQFKRDAKCCLKRGKDMDKLRTVLHILAEQAAIPNTYQDHQLYGNRKGYRDIHIEPDWLLIYQVVGDELHLIETGTHSDLF